jgi:hypothetical protein
MEIVSTIEVALKAMRYYYVFPRMLCNNVAFTLKWRSPLLVNEDKNVSFVVSFFTLNGMKPLQQGISCGVIE